MSYHVDFTKAAVRDLKRLPREAQIRIDAAIELLGENPHPPAAKKLKGRLSEYYRVRVGSFRVIYRIEEDRLVVCVVRVQDRKDVYR